MYSPTCCYVLQVAEVRLANDAEYQLIFSAVTVLGLELPRRQEDSIPSVA